MIATYSLLIGHGKVVYCSVKDLVLQIGKLLGWSKTTRGAVEKALAEIEEQGMKSA